MIRVIGVNPRRKIPRHAVDARIGGVDGDLLGC